LSLKIVASGKQSYRKLASLLSVLKAAFIGTNSLGQGSNQHPESEFWELRREGVAKSCWWFAVLYTFGMECHVGAG